MKKIYSIIGDNSFFQFINGCKSLNKKCKYCLYFALILVQLSVANNNNTPEFLTNKAVKEKALIEIVDSATNTEPLVNECEDIFKFTISFDGCGDGGAGNLPNDIVEFEGPVSNTMYEATGKTSGKKYRLHHWPNGSWTVKYQLYTNGSYFAVFRTFDPHEPLELCEADDWMNEGCYDGTVDMQCEIIPFSCPTIPVITTQAIDGANLGCNPQQIDAPIFSVEDECNDAAEVEVTTSSIVEDGCKRSQTWTANYTNPCGGVPAESVSITYHWIENVETFKFTISFDGCGAGGAGNLPTDIVEFEGPVSNVLYEATGKTSGKKYRLHHWPNGSWTVKYQLYTNGSYFGVFMTLGSHEPIELCEADDWINEGCYDGTVEMQCEIIPAACSAPIITTQAIDGTDLGCNPQQIEAPEFMVNDDSNDEAEVEVTASPIVEDGCKRSQTWTANYTSSCGGKSAESVSITYHWIENVETFKFTISFDGCSLLPNDIVEFEGPVSNVLYEATGKTSGESYRLHHWPNGSWTVKYKSSTKNRYSAVFRTLSSHEPIELCEADDWMNEGCYNGTVEMQCEIIPAACSAPIITTQAIDGTDLGCNPQQIEAPEFMVNDDSNDEAEVEVTASPIVEDGCKRSQTWTANYTSSCGGKSAESVSITYHWIENVETFKFTISFDGCSLLPNDIVEFEGPISNVLYEATGKTSGESYRLHHWSNGSWTVKYKSSTKNRYSAVFRTLGPHEPEELCEADDWMNEGCYDGTVDMQCEVIPAACSAPVITTQAIDGTDLGCNPQQIEAPKFTVNDDSNDEAEVEVTASPIVEDGCKRSQTWTANYTSSCGGKSAESVSITYHWIENVETFKFTISFDGCSLLPNDIVEFEGPISNVLYEATGKTSGESYRLHHWPNGSWTVKYKSSTKNRYSAVFMTLGPHEPEELCEADDWMNEGCYDGTVEMQCEIIPAACSAPVITTLAVDVSDLGCNPQQIDAPKFTVNDDSNDVAEAEVTASPIVEDVCKRSQTWTANYTSSCGEVATSVSITYYWTEDNEVPVITIPEIDSLCNDSFPAILEASWTDNCDIGGTLEATPENIRLREDGCAEFADYIFEVTDSCKNYITKTVTVEREFDNIKCETAFAKGENATCFIGDGDYGFNRWGWRNEIIQRDDPYVMNLYAGAAHCDTNKGELAGTAVVSYNNGEVSVEYQMIDGFYLTEAHINIACSNKPYPYVGKSKKKKATVAPGKYTYVDSGLQYVSTYTLGPVKAKGTLQIIIHGVVCEISCDCSNIERGGSDSYQFRYGGKKGDPSTIKCGNDSSMSKVENLFGQTSSTKIIKDQGIKNVIIYPVPFEDVINVKYNFDYDTEVTVNIYDIRGRLIRKAVNGHYLKGTDVSKQFNMSDYSNQFLIIGVSTNRDSFVKKVVPLNY